MFWVVHCREREDPPSLEAKNICGHKFLHKNTKNNLRAMWEQPTARSKGNASKCK